uniref:G-protein coupled receptor Mth n=1 Tax=Drosophila rhopaloa TaxID=1041015 RepID=A0A6P4EXS7_DRORH
MRLLLGYLAAVILLMVQHSSAEIDDCDFFDTVSLSADQRIQNGSYLYEGVLIPAHLTGEYDFIFANGSKKWVPSYMRGCVCKLRTCVRFCCLHDHSLDPKYNEESQCNIMLEDHQEMIDPFVDITLKNGSVVKRHFKNDLIVQWDLPMPCGDPYKVDNQNEGDNYTLYENGTFIRHYDNVVMNKREYCLQHFLFKDENNNITKSVRIVAHNCPNTESKTGQTIVMITSLFFMALTICAHLLVEQLRNLHGKCIICYLVCIFMGFLFLLLDLWKLSLSFCALAGFMGYFFVMAAFFWLSVISLRTFTKLCNKFKWLSLDEFAILNTYAWGLAGALTGVTYTAQKFVANENWNPRVGAGHCWIATNEWSAMLYFYGPMVLLIAFNITMFTRTAMEIMKSNREMKFFEQKQESHTYFLRLFIVMGMTWSFEIISYFVQNDTLLRRAFLVTDYINWSQGVIIFLLFILRRKILKPSKER